MGFVKKDTHIKTVFPHRTREPVGLEARTQLMGDIRFARLNGKTRGAVIHGVQWGAFI